DELADLPRVLGVVLPRAVVLDLLELLGHRGQDGYRGVAAALEVLREGGSVVAAKLEPHEHRLTPLAGEHVPEVLVGGVEARAADVHRHGPVAAPVRPACSELVESLAGVHAHVHWETAGIGLLAVGLVAVAIPGAGRIMNLCQRTGIVSALAKLRCRAE